MDLNNPSSETAVPSSEVTVHVRVEGRVQGVGFRYFVLEKAQSLGLRGWVRNRWDESVEILAQGPRDVLDRFLSLVQRGPRSAFVQKLEVEWLPSDPHGQVFRDFHIRPTQ